MIAARFHDLRDRTAAAVDGVFAEQVRLSPMTGGRPDPARPQYIFEAILRTSQDQMRAPTGSVGTGQDWRARFADAAAQLHVNMATYNGPQFMVGDKIRAQARLGEPVFSILHVEGAEHSRLIVHLGEAS
jgi:hypothetical protein